MTREKKPVNWGQPGQTGVGSNGVPWYVPEKPPGLMERMLAKTIRGNEAIGAPAGARFVPARTPAEVRDRCMIKHRDRIAEFVHPSEEIAGFIGCYLDDHVPQPPRTGIGARVGPVPVKNWWMGGGWDSAAGRLVTAAGSTRDWELGQPSTTNRHMTWVRTSQRILVLIGPMSAPDHVIGEYAPDQVGLRSSWTPLKGQPHRVDIAFSDGSWLGILASIGGIPGPVKDLAQRSLLVELAGPPVVSVQG